MILPAPATASTNVEKILEASGAGALKSDQSGDNAGRATIALMIVVGIASVAAGVGMALYITRLLVGCIAQLNSAARKMAAGDFDVERSGGRARAESFAAQPEKNFAFPSFLFSSFVLKWVSRPDWAAALCACSSVDRAPASGAGCAGSIPVRRIKRNSPQNASILRGVPF